MRIRNFRRRRRHLDINLTSLIDVVFMLLIFFMIGSNFDKPGITVSLPTAISGERIEKKTLNIVIDAVGKIYWEGRELSSDELTNIIAPLVLADPSLIAALYCDGEAPFKRVAEAMDAVKKGGIIHAAIRHEYPR